MKINTGTKIILLATLLPIVIAIILFAIAKFLGTTIFLISLFTIAGLVCGYTWGEQKGKSKGFKEGYYYIVSNQQSIERLRKYFNPKEISELANKKAEELIKRLDEK